MYSNDSMSTLNKRVVYSLTQQLESGLKVSLKPRFCELLETFKRGILHASCFLNFSLLKICKALINLKQ